MKAQRYLLGAIFLLFVLGGHPSVARGQHATSKSEQLPNPEQGPDYIDRWAISKVLNPPSAENLAEKTKRFYDGARGVQVSQALAENGVLQYQAVSYMASYALRTEVYHPDGTIYSAISWVDGSVYEYRPMVASPTGSSYKNVIVRYDGSDLPEVTYNMLVPFEEACKVGNLSISWIAADDEEPACDAHVRYMREGVVVGEASVEDVECWVVRRGFSVPDDDGTFTVEHLHFMDKHTGRPVRWVTTQTTDSTSTERVRQFDEIIILTEAPDVNWRLGDYVMEQSQPTNSKGESE